MSTFSQRTSKGALAPPKFRRVGGWVGLGKFLAETPRVSKETKARIAKLKRYFFVSYARDDSMQVEAALAPLRVDHRFWVDHVSLAPGARWSADIVAAIRGCRAMLIFCSRTAFASNDVYRELAMAGRYDKPILPIFLDDAPAPDEFLYYLSIHQSIRLDEADWRTRLACALDLLSAGKKPKEAPATCSPAPQQPRARDALG